jgi:ketosteroid isomerase-like protein
MKMKTVILYMLGSLLLAGSAWAQAGKSADTEKAVMTLEHKWLESQKTNNTDLLDPLFADKVVITSSEGKITIGKAAVIAEAKGQKWASADYTEEKINVFGDTAIVTGVFTGKGTDAAGKAIDDHERYTDTWVKMPGGQWQCVASQGSIIKK